MTFVYMAVFFFTVWKINNIGLLIYDIIDINMIIILVYDNMFSIHGNCTVFGKTYQKVKDFNKLSHRFHCSNKAPLNILVYSILVVLQSHLNLQNLQ